MQSAGTTLCNRKKVIVVCIGHEGVSDIISFASGGGRGCKAKGTKIMALMAVNAWFNIRKFNASFGCLKKRTPPNLMANVLQTIGKEYSETPTLSWPSLDIAYEISTPCKPGTAEAGG